MKIINLEQRSPEWHAWRKGVITASNVATVLGHSQYSTPYQLWGETVGIFERPDLSANPNVRKGVEMEDAVRSAIEQSTDIKSIFKERTKDDNLMLLPICAESSKYPFLGCSFDGLQFTGESSGIPVEIKYPSERTWTDVLVNKGNASAYQLYHWQVRHQMIVAGASWGLLVFGQETADGSIELVHFVIEREEALDTEIIEACKQFKFYVDTNTAPERDPSKDIFVPNEREYPFWEPIVNRIRENRTAIDELKAQIEPLKAIEDEEKAKLASLMQGFARASFNGVSITNSVRKGSVDYTRLLIDHGLTVSQDIADKYRGEPTLVTQLRVSAAIPSGDPQLAPPSLSQTAMILLDHNGQLENDYF